MMPNLDRFSRPLGSERFDAIEHLKQLQEQQELNKYDLVESYVWGLYDNTGKFPDTRDVLDHFEHIYLDMDTVSDIIADSRRTHR